MSETDSVKNPVIAMSETDSVKNPVIAMTEIEDGNKSTPGEVRQRRGETTIEIGDRRSSITLHLPAIYTAEQDNNIKERGYLASKMLKEDDFELEYGIQDTKDRYKKNIFDSCYESFNLKVFVIHFIGHLMPIPFYILTLGGRLLPKDIFNFENHGYNPLYAYWLLNKGAWTYFYSDQVASTVFLALITSFFLVSSKTEEGASMSPRGILGFNIVIPLCLYILHRFAVSVKFATLSKTELCRFANSSYRQALIYQNNMQLLSSWISRSITLLDFEIEAASIR